MMREHVDDLFLFVGPKHPSRCFLRAVIQDIADDDTFVSLRVERGDIVRPQTRPHRLWDIFHPYIITQSRPIFSTQ